MPAASALRTARHQLVWLDASGWQAALAGASPEHRDALLLWQQRQAPLVVRRHEPDARPSQICLGLPMPPDAISGHKLRIALKAERRHIAHIKPALPLHLTLGIVTPWQDSLAEFAHAAQPFGLQVYGSMAMQVLTGLPYLSDSSDIDLLFHPRSARQLEQYLTLLTAYAGCLPLDGEIIFPGDQAVAWKEWRQAQTSQAKVLVKTGAGVRLSDTASLLATLEQH
ncbi:malonate decarboxylase holo-[acyl-carrier-protein] synthase [Duganella qianjiadongensis]|uniref:Malonate decarboxylase holo-[acyl-carrier-protein] synthase n=1 Tax=Duganella qianjiadongensis TaxID=2692176 RepID=A0ABW9VI76_9BURK|nr:malonate decarboxylase holo-[acyl-carrier-protein] synthase [Duganella qianjiadongensis]MYM39321.1 malonate decarboxylase holo-[acyl-carrier-protein] synthase [Duganella qianjiadongensis]